MMPFRSSWLLAFCVLGVLACATSSGRRATECPREAPKMRRIAVHFAGWPMYLEARGLNGLPTVDSTHVRTLTAEQGDGATCARMMRLIRETESALASPGIRLTFFEVGQHYYVVGVRSDWVDPPPPNTIRLGWSVLWVVTAGREPKVIARIAV